MHLFSAINDMPHNGLFQQAVGRLFSSAYIYCEGVFGMKSTVLRKINH